VVYSCRELTGALAYFGVAILLYMWEEDGFGVGDFVKFLHRT